MDDECAFRISWDGLEVEATCPPQHAAQVLGLIGNEMLRLNAALIARSDSKGRQSLDDVVADLGIDET